MKLNALSVASLVLAVAALGVSAGLALKQAPLGAQPGPDVDSPSQAVNGVRKHLFSSGLNQASTTICSFKTPAATSTLTFASMQVNTASSTALEFEMGKSTVMDATTTRISLADVAASTRVTLTAFVASTTGAYGALSQKHTADEQDLVFAPNTYLNVKYGKGLGTVVNNGLVGSCKAEFVEN